MQGIYRSLLAGKKVLLLLDNARNEWQVEPLLPPEPAGLLVTSRNRLYLRDTVSRNVDLLSPPEAEALLADILANRQPRPTAADLAELARQCGFLPLALRVAGSYLAVSIAPTPCNNIWPTWPTRSGAWSG